MLSTINRADILTMYDIDTKGVIITPGKFQGEYIYAPYFRALMLEGESIRNFYDREPNPIECLDIFELIEEDIMEFPELIINGYSVGDRISFTETDNELYTECRKVVSLNEEWKPTNQEVTS